MPDYQVRRAELSDIDTIVRCNCGIALETENKQLNVDLVTRGVTRAFEQGDEAVYFVADVVHEGDAPRETIGTLMLTREWSDWRDGFIAWIQSVYVQKDHRGVGVFGKLLATASEYASSQPDVRGLRLYVENDNQRAQAVYAKHGFVDPHYKVLEKMF